MAENNNPLLRFEVATDALRKVLDHLRSSSRSPQHHTDELPRSPRVYPRQTHSHGDRHADDGM